MPSRQVFVIDDDDFTAVHLESIMGDAFDLTHFSSAEEAIPKVREVMPSMILMDVNMPVINGITLMNPRHLL